MCTALNWFDLLAQIASPCFASAQPWRLPFSPPAISPPRSSFPLALPPGRSRSADASSSILAATARLQYCSFVSAQLSSHSLYTQGTTGVTAFSRDPRVLTPGTADPSSTHPKHINIDKHPTHAFGSSDLAPEHRVHDRDEDDNASLKCFLRLYLTLLPSSLGPSLLTNLGHFKSRLPRGHPPPSCGTPNPLRLSYLLPRPHLSCLFFAPSPPSGHHPQYLSSISTAPPCNILPSLPSILPSYLSVVGVSESSC